ncbi:acetyl-CoA carboxylase biotin carboxyl carrier protein subunit [Agrobacterium vitis]|uniref:Biotin carboxyl carrier protein of acetyl-CoA carboxylase n=1 Tax=Agrobacterium vitis TaxID=373 RepID=A0A368NJG5_AGRVI|nr:biotin/lipoyl-containing protein [Agrobacterium vitis]KAA3507752.1 acetyl-CoA carboxylase biotin carboxyl carrier protein subunit [Agrobacterium vitis]KAA3522270.1 acetyl-CoA carboxylase biotin carboxyl carrier protein subunit [Agrobacterium vitis]MCF1478968.1 acetyl-CoA carboxylase biotin carboxyl carrier protein subunit [Agrobacterium vitis]MUZ75677.1 acetyl-CoA carboxylase biotin carboxyl carrier protein subunit [Agrobacterium vitis]MUZ98876.1 acetyl-CoA carboxylase biotin carboxyl carri
MDLDKIKTLIDFVGQSRISELSVTENGTTVRISHYAQAQDAAVTGQKDSVAEQTNPSASGSANTVSTPVFGIFHRAPNPGATPFVSVGDQVEVGQSLFIIEAMKVFNTIAAERAGKVVRILAGDGQEVDAGQPVLEIAG